MSNYLGNIDHALLNHDWPYAVNAVWKICRDILQNQKLSKDEKTKIIQLQKDISAADYMNPYSYKIDDTKLNLFRNLSKELWQFVNYDLGLD